jgi:hypothetical protein
MKKKIIIGLMILLVSLGGMVVSQHEKYVDYTITVTDQLITNGKITQLYIIGDLQGGRAVSLVVDPVKFSRCKPGITCTFNLREGYFNNTTPVSVSNVIAVAGILLAILFLVGVMLFEGDEK